MALQVNISTGNPMEDVLIKQAIEKLLKKSTLEHWQVLSRLSDNPKSFPALVKNENIIVNLL